MHVQLHNGSGEQVRAANLHASFHYSAYTPTTDIKCRAGRTEEQLIVMMMVSVKLFFMDCRFIYLQNNSVTLTPSPLICF